MTGYSEAQAVREEALARLLAAQEMGLTKDPIGFGLPDDLWKQRLERAKHLLQEERDPLADLRKFNPNHPALRDPH